MEFRPNNSVARIASAEWNTDLYIPFGYSELIRLCEELPINNTNTVRILFDHQIELSPGYYMMKSTVKLIAEDGISIHMGSSRRIKSSETMFSIIDAFREHGPLRITDLSNIVGMSKGNIHHHLTTLREYGYVVKHDGKYAIGLEFFAVGVNTRSRHPIYRAAKNELPQLAAKTGETSWCMVEENGKGIFIDGYVSGASLNPDAVIGTWKPLHVSSAGKAILANLSEHRREFILDRDGLESMTKNTITNRDELYQELEKIREQGYSINLEEDVSGIHAVGAAIFNDDAEVVGGISVGGAATRLTEEYCERELVPFLKASADNIEVSLAYK